MSSNYVVDFKKHISLKFAESTTVGKWHWNQPMTTSSLARVHLAFQVAHTKMSLARPAVGVSSA